MGLDTIVGVHPERIRSIDEVDEILSKIDRYERETHCEAVVVLKQNKHLGGSCIIVSKEEAIDGITRDRTSEWYVKPFYPRSYFERLRERLSD